MGRTNGNQKGKRGERQACKLLRDFGYEARRSQQYSGVRTDETSADILTDIPGIRWEIKYGYDSTHIYSKQMKEWVDTAREETPDDKNWAILRRKTRKKWTIIFEIDGIVCQSSEIEKVINYLK